MSYWRKRLDVFKQPGFGWYIVSNIFISFGASLGYVAINWMILSIQNSVWAVALFNLCFWVPNIIFTPLLGVFVDRYSRKAMLMASSILRAVVLLIFGFWLKSLWSLYTFYGLALMLGVGFTVVIPSVMAFIRELVPKEQLMYANATVDIAFEIGNVLGAGLAGLFVAAFSGQATLVFNGICFIVAALLLLKAKPAYRPEQKTPDQPRRFKQEFMDGLKYLSGHPELMLVYSIQLVFFVCFMITPILLGPFVKQVLHAKVMQYGLINASLSIGIIAGGLVTPWLADRFGLMRVIGVVMGLLAIEFLLFSFNRSMTWAEVLYFVIGLSVSVWPLIMTQAQDLAALDFQGRVQACFTSLSSACSLGVFLLVSIGSEFIAIPHIYWFETALMVLGLVLLRAFCLIKNR